MRTAKSLITSLLLITTMTMTQGCAVLLVTGAVAGATYGTVKYVQNTLKVNENVSLNKAWDAANAALKELQMPIATKTKDALSGKLTAHNAQNQPITITLTRQTETVTDIEITVGTFDSTANRSQARQIYDKMKARF